MCRAGPSDKVLEHNLTSYGVSLYIVRVPVLLKDPGTESPND